MGRRQNPEKAQTKPAKGKVVKAQGSKARPRQDIGQQRLAARALVAKSGLSAGLLAGLLDDTSKVWLTRASACTERKQHTTRTTDRC